MNNCPTNNNMNNTTNTNTNTNTGNTTNMNLRMSEQDIMNDLLTMEKQITSAYNTGITESSCKNLRQTLTNTLTDTQNIQYTIFDTMRKHGWYSTKDASDQEVNNVKNKFNQIQNQL